MSSVADDTSYKHKEHKDRIGLKTNTLENEYEQKNSESARRFQWNCLVRR